MKTLGIGIDIIQNNRVEKLVKKKFLSKEHLEKMS